jgi:hypothetical protein
MRTQYDLSTAITFLMLDLGAGALLALILGPRQVRVLQDPVRSTERKIA